MRRTLLLVVLASCVRDDDVSLTWMGDTAEAPGVLMTTKPDGSVAFVRRLDGKVGLVFEDGGDYVVLTGPEAGRDQRKVMILGSDGQLKAEYRPPGATPWGGLARLSPSAGRVIPFRRAGRRYLAVATTGNDAAVSITILERVGDRLVERFVFWNYGHFTEVLIGEEYLGVFGLTSKYEGEVYRYSPAFAIFRWE